MDYDLLEVSGPNYKLASQEVIDKFLLEADFPEVKSKKTKKSSKPKTVKSKKKSTSSSKSKSSKLKKCKVCGTTLPENSKSDLCRKCSKKAHAVKVLEEIIPITGVGIPFNKDDLNNLYENNVIKTNDTIWTLQDFSLVKSIDSNLFELASENQLNQFFKENNSSNVVSDLLSKSSDKALQKTCLKCNKTLPISEFRKTSEDKYSDYCKSCDKKIKTAQYVIEFIEDVGFDEFLISDVNIENVQGKLFNLQDADLVIFNGQYYKLADENTVYSFISQNGDDNSVLDDIVDAFKTHKTMIKAAKSVGVSNIEVTKFYIEGKYGNYKYIKFFRDINEIKKAKLEDAACPKCKKKKGYDNAKCKNCGHINVSLLSLDEKIDYVLSVIRENHSVKSAKQLDIPYDNIKRWDKLGKAGIAPYNKFSTGIINIKRESKDLPLKRDKIAKIEERLNDNLRQIQRNQVSLDKNILKLKSVDLSNKEIKSQYYNLTSDINNEKYELNSKKNEIKTIKDNLSKYSLDELDKVKEFDIKTTRSITLRVNKLLKKNDKYIEQKEEINKNIEKLENELKELKTNMEDVEKLISKLKSESFDDSLKSDYDELIKELNKYISNLNNTKAIIEKNISKLKSKKSNFKLNDVEINLIDYSSKVNDLISKNAIKKEKDKGINGYEVLLIKINDELTDVHRYIYLLNNANFVPFLLLDRDILINKLEFYKSNLNESRKNLENTISKFRQENKIIIKSINVDFIDYSGDVNELISKNEYMISKKILIPPSTENEDFPKKTSKPLSTKKKNVPKHTDVNKFKAKNKVNEYETLLLKVDNEIESVNGYIAKLNRINFDRLLINDKNTLINKLENYKSNLNDSKKDINRNILKLKYNTNPNIKSIDVNFIDYSGKVNELISKNKHSHSKKISKPLSTTKKNVSKHTDVNKFKAKNKVNEYETLLLKVDNEIKNVGGYIAKLNRINFDTSLINDKYTLINKLKNYKSNLNDSKRDINTNILKLKYNTNPNIKSIDVNFIDYSGKVNELISKNQNLNNKYQVKKDKDKPSFMASETLKNDLHTTDRYITETNNYIFKLRNTIFLKPFNKEKFLLLGKLKNYMIDLNNYKKNIQFNLDNISDNELVIEKFKYIDYSSDVNNLISENEKLTFEKMELIIDYLDEDKDLKTICDDLEISLDNIQSWHDLGKSGKKDYIKFYDKISVVYKKMEEIKQKEKEEKEKQEKLRKEQEEKEKQEKLRKEQEEKEKQDKLRKEQEEKENTIKNYKQNISEINNEITKNNEHISKLNSTNFIESLITDKYKLINKINNYNYTLKSKLEYFETKLNSMNTDSGYFNFINQEVDYIDYSSEVNDLISENEKIISEQMKLIIDNLDVNKDLRTISDDLKVSCDNIKSWYDLGKSGDSKYADFYMKIKQFNEDREKNIENKKSNSGVFSKLINRFKRKPKDRSQESKK
ncbi:hypothetical protein [Methanobrevibacter millerae]|nr:hypothetical protein [Methanobrevibacter millerae]